MMVVADKGSFICFVLAVRHVIVAMAIGVVIIMIVMVITDKGSFIRFVFAVRHVVVAMTIVRMVIVIIVIITINFDRCSGIVHTNIGRKEIGSDYVIIGSPRNVIGHPIG